MERYVFSTSSSKNVSVRRLCDMLVHSEEFMPAIYEDKVISLYFNSDRTAEYLYECGLTDLITLAREVSRDDVVAMRWIRDPKTGKDIHVLRSRKIPSDDTHV